MTWFGWTLLAFWAVSFTLVLTDLGKPSKPMTPGRAATLFVVYVVLATAILTVGTGKGL